MSLVLLELMTTDRNLSGLGIGSSVLTKYIFYKKYSLLWFQTALEFVIVCL